MNRFITYSMIFSAFLFASCSKGLHAGGSASNGEAPVKEITINPMVATKVNDFSFNLLHHVEADQPKEENFFISPLSLHMDLGMLVNGSAGTTYDEMLKTLGLEGQNLDEVNKAYKTLLKDLPKADPKVKLGLYNSIWYRKPMAFKAAFVSSVKKNFEATVTPLDFKPEDVSVINGWAGDKTNGKVQKVLDVIQPEDVMFLLNALYFKGDWASKFDKAKTHSTDFHLENGSTKSVQMMYQTEKFKSYSTDDYTAVRLPYGNGQFAMTVILPAEGRKLNEVLAGLSSADWETIKDNMHESKINLGLPRFTIPAYEIKLNNVLKSMGMQSAFNNGADFSKMSDAGNLEVSFVKQNTYLKVDEEGTEAAAVTSTGITVTSVPIIKQVLCDHPFGLVIGEQTSNTILFMGKIMDPDAE